MITIDEYKFNTSTPEKIRTIKHWGKDVGSNWPVVYIINNKTEAYIGETVSASKRMEQHLQNQQRLSLTELHIASDESFNKSVILDLESFLIKYMASDGKFSLQNGNNGIQNHEYYNKSAYQQEFRNLWNELKTKGLVKNDIIDIENSELFKYSPYKSLGAEQIEVEKRVLENLRDYGTTEKGVSVIVQGGAGTGKTILAIYLIKLLADASARGSISPENPISIDFLSEEEETNAEAIYAEDCFEGMHKIGIVFPQKPLQNSVKDVFSKIKGLSEDMVLSPSDVVKNYIETKEKYDLLIVDESHRLKCRYQGHLSDYQTFDKHNRELGLEKMKGTELDWILLCSRNQVLLYDSLQAVRPCDIPSEDFSKIIGKYKEVFPVVPLTHQWRCAGGNDYINYLKNILACRQPEKENFDNYEFKLYLNCSDMIQAIKDRDAVYGLCRVGAGFAWPWKAKKDPSINDVKVDGKEYHWNRNPENWITSSTAINEIGCIHTLQGYDLNYAGIIIGNDIRYDKSSNSIVAVKENYHDQQGKSGVANKPEELREYLINIYLTLLTRGIKGTYVYVCDEALREYMKQYIDVVE